MKSTFLKHTGLIGAMVLMAGFSASSYVPRRRGIASLPWRVPGRAVVASILPPLAPLQVSACFRPRSSSGCSPDCKYRRYGSYNELQRRDPGIFLGYHLDYAMWQPFIGASLGVQYGSGVKDAFFIGPEIGAKYYVMPKTFILGQVAYQFQVDEDVDDGSTFYTLGIGFNF